MRVSPVAAAASLVVLIVLIGLCFMKPPARERNTDCELSNIGCDR